MDELNAGGSEEGERLFATARSRLLSMTFFGLFERLEESMALLAHTFCWEPPSQGEIFRPRPFNGVIRGGHVGLVIVW